MSTRARIAMKNDDGSFTSVYTHNDGYPSHHGPILLEHYTDPAKVKALIALGDLSSLGDEIGDKHDFDDRGEDACTAYGRDRGETGVKPRKSKTLKALSKLAQETGGEYLYLFDDGKWLATKGGVAAFGLPADKAPGALRPLAELIEEDKD